MIVKHASLALLFVLLAGTAAAQEQAPPPPCQGAEHRQFDFWVGDWSVQTPNGRQAGTNRIQTILNGCVLLENWEGTRGSTGKSFNMYNRADGKWHQTWVDGNGGRLDLSGGLEGAEMVLRGAGKAPDGSALVHEIRWTPNDDGSVRQHWRSSKDGGKSWTDVFVGVYTKR